jgi:hypothetical protein
MGYSWDISKQVNLPSIITSQLTQKVDAELAQIVNLLGTLSQAVLPWLLFWKIFKDGILKAIKILI